MKSASRKNSPPLLALAVEFNKEGIKHSNSWKIYFFDCHLVYISFDINNTIIIVLTIW